MGIFETGCEMVQNFVFFSVLEPFYFISLIIKNRNEKKGIARLFWFKITNASYVAVYETSHFNTHNRCVHRKVYQNTRGLFTWTLSFSFDVFMLLKELKFCCFLIQSQNMHSRQHLGFRNIRSFYAVTDSEGGPARGLYSLPPRPPRPPLPSPLPSPRPSPRASPRPPRPA